MTPEQHALLITALSPIALGVLGGIGWVIRHVVSRNSTETPPITQGQTIPATALPDYLERELDECIARSRAYRDALIRAGIDPREALERAGITD